MKQLRALQQLFSVIFLGKGKDLLKFFLIATPGSLAAVFEGVSFTFLLVSLYVFNGRGLEVLSDKPFLNQIVHFSFLQEMSNNRLFILFLTAAIVSQLFKSAIVFFASYRANILNARILANVQQKVYEHILSFDFQTVSHYKSGDLANYAQLPVSCVTTITSSLHKILVFGFILGALACLLVKISALSTLIFLSLFVASAFLYRKLVKIIGHYSSSNTKQAAEFTKTVVQSINGIKLIHIFGIQNVVLKKSEAILKKIEHYSSRSGKFESLLMTVSEVFSMIMMAITLLISSFFLIVSSDHSLPLLLTYLAIVYRFTTTVRETLTHVGYVASRFGQVERLHSLFSSEGKSYEKKGGVPAPSIEKNISFHNLSFRYPTKHTFAIKNLSIKIPKGKMTAIAGLSGSGKSTLINLLTRLFTPTEGEILVDDAHLSSIDIASWRSKLGVVSQNSVIFNDTARENITFGTEKTEDEIWEACHLAGCAPFIESLPQGLDTPLGEHGYRISGGEAQRITIARALARNPDILIFDEATSNLDTHNEKLIHQTLENIRNNATLIVIAHRLSTIKDADNILVLEEGKLLEQGTHDTLLSQEGKYAYLWHLQSKKHPEPLIF